MVYHSYHKYFSQSLLLAIYQYTNSLSLSDKQSVIVSVIISVHALGEQRERERERERERDQRSASPHKTPSFGGPLTQP